MKKTGLLLVVLMMSTCMFAQQNVNIASAEIAESPYTINSEDEFVEQFNWLLETPIHENEQRRKEVTASISNWIASNPKLDIELDSNLIKFAETTPELLIVFMGGWAKYAVENNDYQNKLEGNIAGIENVIEFYERNGEFMDKNKNVEKLMKLQDKGKLKRKVEKKL